MAVAEAIDKVFDTIDTDKNGSICKSEMEMAFRLFDKDGNGAISAGEWVKECTSLFKTSEQQATSAFGKLKTNGNGEICLDSFHQLFQGMDSDGDGSISKEEFRKYWTQLLS